MELFSEHILRISPWRLRNKFIAENFLEKDKTILDLGCGATTFKWYYKPKDYFGVDGMPLDDVDLVFDLDNNFQDHIQPGWDYVLNSGIIEFVKRPDLFLKKQKGLGKEYIFTYDKHIGLTTISHNAMDNLISQDYKIIQKEDFGAQRIYKCQV